MNWEHPLHLSRVFTLNIQRDVFILLMIASRLLTHTMHCNETAGSLELKFGCYFR